ncbi:MAG TPA: hypothetical protein VEX38_08060 [Fimbriimonadaceae bacterium]|nr:hypothetical protein [Fimbriimonadaceae bacterium]
MSTSWESQSNTVRRWLDDENCHYIRDHKLRWRELEFSLDYLVTRPIPCIVQLIIPGSTFINRWATVRLLAAQSFGRYLPAIGVIAAMEESAGAPEFDLDFFEVSVPVHELPPLSQLLQRASPDPLTAMLLDKGVPRTDPQISSEDELQARWGHLYSPDAIAQLKVLAEIEQTSVIPEPLQRDYSSQSNPVMSFLVSNLGGEHKVETIRFRGRTPGHMKRDVYVSPSGRRTIIRFGRAAPDGERVDLLRLSTEPWLSRATGFRSDRSVLLLQTYFGPQDRRENERLPVLSGIISFLEAAGWTVLPHNSFYDWMVLLAMLREETGSES